MSQAFPRFLPGFCRCWSTLVFHFASVCRWVVCLPNFWLRNDFLFMPVILRNRLRPKKNRVRQSVPGLSASVSRRLPILMKIPHLGGWRGAPGWVKGAPPSNPPEAVKNLNFRHRGLLLDRFFFENRSGRSGFWNLQVMVSVPFLPCGSSFWGSHRGKDILLSRRLR